MHLLQKAYREYHEYVVSSLLYDDEVDSFGLWANRHYGIEPMFATSFEYFLG